MKKILIIQESMSGGGAEKVLCDLLDNFDYTRYSIDLLLEYQKGTHLQGINKQVKVMSLHTDDIRPFGEKFLFKWKFASDLIHRHQLKSLSSLINTMLSYPFWKVHLRTITLC